MCHMPRLAQLPRGAQTLHFCTWQPRVTGCKHRPSIHSSAHQPCLGLGAQGSGASASGAPGMASMLPSMILMTSEALGRCLASKQVHAWYRSAMACGHSSGTLPGWSPFMVSGPTCCDDALAHYRCDIAQARSCRRVPRESSRAEARTEVPWCSVPGWPAIAAVCTAPGLTREYLPQHTPKAVQIHCCCACRAAKLY